MSGDNLSDQFFASCSFFERKGGMVEKALSSHYQHAFAEQLYML